MKIRIARRTVTVAATAAALVAAMVVTAGASHVGFDDESAWSADRQEPSDVKFDGNLLTYKIDGSDPHNNPHNRTEGMRADLEDVDTISVDLYLDEAWDSENVPLRAGLWGVEAETTGNLGSAAYPIVEFNRSPEGKGFRYWSSEGGWTSGHSMDDLDINYGEWVTLTIEADAENDRFVYRVNGTAVGSAPFFHDGELETVILNARNFGHADDQTEDFDEYSYDVEWRGYDEDRLFNGADAEDEDSIVVEVERDAVLDVRIEVDGDTVLDVDESGEYTATVTNYGTLDDFDLEDWKLGLEVEEVSSLSEVTLEFCEDLFDDATCYDVKDINGVETQLVDGNMIQVLGVGEDTIAPGFSDTFHFRASFRNEGQFTGTAYVLMQ